MGIYISGMDMPEEGWHKVIKIFSDGTVVSYYDSETLGKAIPVPPHGRLGDLDALLKEVNHIYDRYDAGIISEITCMNALAWAIRSAPTIILGEEAQ